MNVLEARRRLLGAGVYKKTVTGNPAIAQGSLARMYPGIEMQGWTEQQSTTGAQLLNQDETVIGGLMGNTGNEFAGTNRIRTGFIKVDPNTTYIISGLSGFNIANSFAYDSEKTVVRIGVVTTTTTTTLENESYLRISFSKPDQSDFTEEELQKLRKTLMFNKGATALPYEPYTGGAPSPSPDYPQEIVSAGNWNEETQKYQYEVQVIGANLFDKSTAIKNKYINDITGELHDTATGDTTASDYVLVGGLSYIRVTATTFAQWLAFYDGNKNFVSGVNGYGKPIPVPQNAEYARFTIPNSVVDTFVINPGETLFPYEPYKPPQTVTLTSDRPLTKWDKLTKKDGVWGWKYGSAEIVFDGSDDENWSIYNSNKLESCRVFFRSFYDSAIGYNKSFCDHFINRSLAWDNGDKGEYSDHHTLTNKYFVMSSEITDTLSEWKTFLQSNPITVWYETTTKTFVQLSASEQEQMNALHTNRPTTVLSNDAGCEMSLTYKTRKSMEVTT